MATLNVPKETPLSQHLTQLVQHKVVSYGWVNEGDSSFCEYVVLSLDGGKDSEEFAAEIAEILEASNNVDEFMQWLISAIETWDQQNGVDPSNHIQYKNQAGTSDGQNGEAQEPQDQNQSNQQDSMTGVSQGEAVNLDEAMGDIPSGPAAGYVLQSQNQCCLESYQTNHPSSPPSGPKSMRSGPSHSRGGRMLGQANKAMSRNNNNQIIHRIKGTANSGRIDTHSRQGTPRGPRGGNRQFGGRSQNGTNVGLIQQAAQHNPQSIMASMNDDQRQLMTGMMDQSFQMLQSLMNMQQQATMNPAAPSPSGMGRGRQQQSRGRGRGKSLFERVGKGEQASQENETQEDEATEKKEISPEEAWKSICKKNLFCTFVGCPFAHQSPQAPPGTNVDLDAECPVGAGCSDRTCKKKHKSPASAPNWQGPPICKYYPYCTNPHCKFDHRDSYPCPNGGDCKYPNCQYTHLRIPCKFEPCTNPACQFQHREGQKQGPTLGQTMKGAHVWTNPGLGGTTSSAGQTAPNDQSQMQTEPSAQPTNGAMETNMTEAPSSMNSEMAVQPQENDQSGHGAIASNSDFAVQI